MAAQPIVCPAPGIAQWLQNTHNLVNSGAAPSWIVLGNESADLDSAVSSLVFAYCLHMVAINIIAIPLLPIPRADFKLRTEIVHFFHLLGLDQRFLYFSDDLVKFSPNPFSSTLQQHQNNNRVPKIGMVDFNKLTPSLQYLSPHVKAVIDHHLPDSGLYPDAAPRIVIKAGSAASLVIRDQRTQIERMEPRLRKELATLAMGAILIDTANLNPAIGRTEPVDLEVMDTIRKWIHAVRDPINEPALYAALSKAKADLGHLTTNELLRKDFKEYSVNQNKKYGIASVNWDFRSWTTRDTVARLKAESLDFANNRGLFVLFMMTTVENNNGFLRQLAMVGPDQNQLDRITNRLKSEAPDVRLALDSSSTSPLLPLYHMDTSMSRKKLQPFIQPIMETI